jgi:hypothetical protein
VLITLCSSEPGGAVLQYSKMREAEVVDRGQKRKGRIIILFLKCFQILYRKSCAVMLYFK